MEEINFLVQGSAAEPYKASFIKDGDSLTAFCTCPAGVNGRACKHRIGILNGSGKGIVSENVEDVQKVKTWLPGSAINEAQFAFAKAELLATAGEKNLSSAKKKLSRVMHG